MLTNAVEAPLSWGGFRSIIYAPNSRPRRREHPAGGLSRRDASGHLPGRTMVSYIADGLFHSTLPLSVRNRRCAHRTWRLSPKTKKKPPRRRLRRDRRRMISAMPTQRPTESSATPRAPVARTELLRRRDGRCKAAVREWRHDAIDFGAGALQARMAARKISPCRLPAMLEFISSARSARLRSRSTRWFFPTSCRACPIIM